MKSCHKFFIGAELSIIGFIFIGYALLYDIKPDSIHGLIAGVLLMIGMPMYFKNLATHLENGRQS
ncbi:hypothetical protein BFS35_000050 [Macrococcoides goetzii]|uniref:Uncharacterized protein n=1 Tax=Macrococcoides goetzii TaxID=1891097 RepID=A0A2G5NNQ6_9STAP|nr:hypothetical protein [Macrococcus goetzii]RAI82112.1 hypothetical protein BFS35_000050 [Macrococcus goetzii]